MAAPLPDRATCNKAIKLLTQFERLARKFGITISAARLDELRRLRDFGIIKSNDLPAKLRAEFPGEFDGMTLDEVRDRCGKD